jgi:gliding motility-associated-like protein
LNTLKQFIIGLVFVSFSLPGIARTDITGKVNAYTKVVTCYSNTDSIIVSDASKFKVGDTVMLIQMTGADISVTNAINNIYGAGLYEFHIIQRKTANRLRFVSNMINTYSAAEALQLVKVPSYRYAKVTGSLICSPWNADTAGVIAIIVKDTLDLYASIDASYKGFQGASNTVSSNKCTLFPKSLNYLIANIDSAGLKGQGIVQKSFVYKRGLGAIGNAGGGGNGFGSGGGGGGGQGSGGGGGRASGVYCTTIDSLVGGGGGKIPPEYFAGTTDGTRDRIFMGGGGGSSRGLGASDATKGGAGGGIIFIITNTLKTNGNTIRSNGEDILTDAINEAGAGGGGGGGSILIAAEKLVGTVNVEVKGGKGGNSNHCTGQGGGGGGGFVWFSGQFFSFGSLNLSGGNSGSGPVPPTCPLNSTATIGTKGDSANRLNPVLKGFLFNQIGQKQTICYNTIPQPLTGSTPRGGNGQYKYQWQSRSKSTSWLWKNITGANQIDYSAPALKDTTQFHRIVKSASFKLTTDTIIDTSKFVIISVIPEIKSNTIVPDTAICYGQNQIKIRGPALSGGDGTLTCLWEESTDNSSWNNASGTNTLVNYSNTSNSESKYYRRKVFSNICTNTSNAVHLTIYPLISNDNIQQPQIICNNSKPQTLLGSAPSGGDNVFHYRWLKNIGDSLHWTSTGPADTFQNYSPASLTANTFYRRAVFSGLRNTCKDTSSALKILVLPSITQNQIQQDQTICGGTSPITFTGQSPAGGGNNGYNFQWELSNDKINWDSITSGPNLNNYMPGILNVTKYFRRIVRSGYHDCCKDTSNYITTTVQPSIQNNNIVNNQEICYAQKPAKLIQGSGTLAGGSGPFTFLWQQHSADVKTWSNITVSGNQSGYQPDMLTQTTYYRRIAMSGVCTHNSDSLTISVLAELTGNTLSGNSEVCDGQVPSTIAGAGVSGGQPGVYRYVWQDSASTRAWSTIPNAQDDSYTPYVLSQKTSFRRIVKSGTGDCCISTSAPFEVSINPLPEGALSSLDTAICQGTLVNAQLTISSGTPPFETIFTEGTIQAMISNLQQGKTEVSFVPEKSGTYYILSIKDQKGCWATMKDGVAKIRLVKIPKALVGDNALIDGKKFQLTAVSDFGTGKWIPESDRHVSFEPSDTAHNAIITVDGSGTYRLVWKISNEFCWDTTSLEIVFFTRYTGFSPNNDNINDFFVFEGLDNFKKELTVINRWGNEVFSSDDYKNNWNGTNNNGKPLPDDTYFYILKINNNRVYKGYIVIRR